MSIWQESMSMLLKNVYYIHTTCLLLFYDFGVYPIADNFPFFLQLFEVIRKTAANLGETFIQS